MRSIESSTGSSSFSFQMILPARRPLPALAFLAWASYTVPNWPWCGRCPRELSPPPCTTYPRPNTSTQSRGTNLAELPAQGVRGREVLLEADTKLVHLLRSQYQPRGSAHGIIATTTATPRQCTARPWVTTTAFHKAAQEAAAPARGKGTVPAAALVAARKMYTQPYRLDLRHRGQLCQRWVLVRATATHGAIRR